MEGIKDILRGLQHLLYPNLCEGCNTPLLANEEVLCMACNMQLPLTGYSQIANNETAQRFAGRLPFQHAISLAYFTTDGLLQHLLHGLKYKNRQQIGIFLGKLLGYELKGTNWINEIDIIMPVPLHAKKQLQRGYNQSIIIAEGLSEVIKKPVVTNAIKRTRATETQTRKTREERVENMNNAFAINEHTFIEGKHILLIDDVLTTGATLEACGLALLSKKDVKVSIGTVGVAI